MTIAVTGATGQLGRLVVASCNARRPGEIVALARDPAKAADLGVPSARPTIQARHARQGARGVDTLLLISSSEIGQRAASTQRHRRRPNRPA